MTPALGDYIQRLSITQQQAVAWGDGACLVLAGPGVGKTTVLTARIARILDSSREKNFRVLALTFTTKAGDEMRTRVEQIVPGLTDRTSIGTFHSFAAQLLRQHGSHLGMKPDFGVYDQDSDREELLKEALAEAAAGGEAVTIDDVRWLKTIDQLRSRLVGPKKTAARFANPKEGERAARVYAIYEAALKVRNYMDFNGMILNMCRLAHEFPAVATRIRRSYPYWLIDEFQDTSPAQYKMIRLLAGEEFKNVFAVADDDQIIYEWAGASYKQIVSFRQHFTPNLIQLVENRRCPPEVVAAANNLVKHNVDRTPGKASLLATLPENGPAISTRVFDTDQVEAKEVAKEIANAGNWGTTAVLGRTRALLQPVFEALRAASVNASLVTRRDRFLSPQFVWLQLTLNQFLRPADRRNFIAAANAANRIAHSEDDPDLLATEAEASGQSYLEYWAAAAMKKDNAVLERLAELTLTVVKSPSAWRTFLSDALPWLPETAGQEAGIVSDADDDKAAWDATVRAIRKEKGSELDLAELLQGLALRPKDPPNDPDAVNLLTIHSAKGLEFDTVWLIGLAESVLPSWQSLKSDSSPAMLEEERRSCFVAITRTKKSLILSHAHTYNGWNKAPSRFLDEMGFVS
jgi:DNA helicase-2/ATP-dependent DNA helicase PcrA